MRRRKFSRPRKISDLGGLGDRPRRPFGVSILIVIQLFSILMIVSMDLVNFNLIRLDIPRSGAAREPGGDFQPR